jgi:3-vinyl bacteriochlorophyllide hydratase
LSAQQQLWLALAAYAAYLINAAQFVWKLRAARLQAEAMTLSPSLPEGASA